MNSKIFFLLFVAFLLHITKGRQLKFIEVVSRHGVRYPSFPNQYDHSNITTIRHAHNELTIEGKSMHYLLGKQLYQKYWKLLFSNTPYESKFDKSLIFAKSTNTNRTIESLQSQIIGLLEELQTKNQIKPNQFYLPPFFGTKKDSKVLSPAEQQKLSSLFTFPIHVQKGAEGDPNVANIDFEGDFLVKEEKNLCPNQPVWEEENFQSPLAKQIQQSQKLKPAFEFLNTIYHRNNVTIKDAYQYFDNYVCLKAMGQAYLPDFEQEKVYQSLQFLYVGRLYLGYLYTQQQKRTFSTRLIANTIQNMKKSYQKTNPKIVLYATHDITLAILLSSMNFTSIQCIAERYLDGKNDSRCYYKYPSFASTFIFQLWEEDDGELTVDMLINGEPYRIPICNYSYHCPLNQIQKWFQAFRVQSPNRQCGVKQQFKPKQFILVLFFIVFWIGFMTPVIYRKLSKGKIKAVKTQVDQAQVSDLIR